MMIASSEPTRTCLVQKLVHVLLSFSFLVVMAAAVVPASDNAAVLDIGFVNVARKPKLEAKKQQEAPDRDVPLPLCSELIADPTRPFHVVWNHPVNCDTKNEPIGFEQYGIDNNSEKKFLGDKIKLYYYAGSWPGYSGDQAINGGLPQGEITPVSQFNGSSLVSANLECGQHKKDPINMWPDPICHVTKSH